MSGPREILTVRSHLARRLGSYVRNVSLMLGTVLLGLYVVVGLAAWICYSGTLTFMNPDISVLYGMSGPSPPTLMLSPFSLGPHMLGQTGGFGFGVAEGLVKGTPWDLMLFAGILVPTALLGLVIGVIAGGLGNAIDDVLMTVTDVVGSIPPFMIALVVYFEVMPNLPTATVTGGTNQSFLARPEAPLVFVLAMVLISWAPYARLARVRAKDIASKPFVEAAAAAGASKFRILFRHILPNSASPMFSQVPITLANLIVIMTILPYVGLLTTGGSKLILVSFMPSSNFPEWTWVLVNGMLGWSVNLGTNAWWGYVFPFLWILAFALAVLLFCDGLEEFLSPRSGSATH
jgi:ABC-type dipeptide/oligopeptide/nickel transport system permease subunit